MLSTCGATASDACHIHASNTQALENLLKNILQPSSTAMLRNCVWALSNFFRGKPQPHVDVFRPALPVLAKVLAACQDKDCLQDAGWSLSYVSDGDNVRIRAVIEAGVLPDLVRHLGHAQASVVTPMLRTLGNLVSGDDGQTQGAGLFDCVLACLLEWSGVGRRRSERVNVRVSADRRRLIYTYIQRSSTRAR